MFCWAGMWRLFEGLWSLQKMKLEQSSWCTCYRLCEQYVEERMLCVYQTVTRAHHSVLFHTFKAWQEHAACLTENDRCRGGIEEWGEGQSLWSSTIVFSFCPSRTRTREHTHTQTHRQSPLPQVGFMYWHSRTWLYIKCKYKSNQA